MSSHDALLDRLLDRCTFPEPETPVICAFSGGPDSTALLALARHASLNVTAVHVNHGLRPSAETDADLAESIASGLGVKFRCEHAHLEDGANLEDGARRARRELLGPDALTGHTTDDQAETVLLALIRGSGATGLSAMRPGPTHPILALRRADTLAVCAAKGIEPAIDPTNTERRFRRNRVRHELLPVLDDIAQRDVAALLVRSADLLRDDDDFLDALGADLDATDAQALAAAPLPVARRALRRWLTFDGYPPDAAAIERVLDVARGHTAATEIGGGLRIRRSAQRLSLFKIPD